MIDGPYTFYMQISDGQEGTASDTISITSDTSSDGASVNNLDDYGFVTYKETTTI